MVHRLLGCAAVVRAFVFLGPAPVAAQTRSASAKKWIAPRTPDGQPDLQGIWSNATITPLERPNELAGKEFFTEQEAAEYEKRIVEGGNRDRRGSDAASDLRGAYNEAWFDRGTKVVPSRRTSLVVDPRDGKIPPLTLEAQKAAAARAEAAKHPPDGPEDFPLLVRCILWPTAGPPMLPTQYNNNYQILQSPGYVTILIEMIHDVRIIPLDGRPRVDKKIRQWMGDSRG